MSGTAQGSATDSEACLRRIVLLLSLSVPAAAGVVWGEVLLAGPIIFFVSILGFWRGYLVFCLVWAGLGLAVLSAWLRVEPWFTEHVGSNLLFKKERAGRRRRERAKSWRDRLALRLAGVGRVLGTLGAVVMLGPVFGWVAFRLLGYRERDVYVLTIAAAWGFGALWVPFYGLGVWGLGLSRVL